MQAKDNSSKINYDNLVENAYIRSSTANMDFIKIIETTKKR